MGKRAMHEDRNFSIVMIIIATFLGMFTDINTAFIILFLGFCGIIVTKLEDHKKEGHRS